MSRLASMKPAELLAILEKLGFVKVRQSGSHVVLRHSDGRWTTVPLHSGKDVAKGTLAKILKDVGLTYEEISRLK